jgi:hypothetical protein
MTVHVVYAQSGAALFSPHYRAAPELEFRLAYLPKVQAIDQEDPLTSISWIFGWADI